MRLATPIICSLLHPTFLVFCYLFGLIQGSEIYSRQKVAGVALCVGAAMAASLMGEELRQSSGGLNWSVLLGTLLLMAGTIFGALMVVYQRESFHLPLIYVEGYAYVFAGPRDTNITPTTANRYIATCANEMTCFPVAKY
mmetsp:Transcript_24385/g.20739  ORF Transcript_24385/g.20739 Transcript_24385/m.20739 type:complete len:140 (+) Transcript_24385:3-422(+)